MIEKWIISMVISFVLRQLDKFGKTIDWAKVKADVDERIAALVPGTWFDAEAVRACNVVIDAIACAMHQQSALEEILKLVADQKWAEAGLRLKDLALSIWNGDACPVPRDEKAVAMLEAHQGDIAA